MKAIKVRFKPVGKRYFFGTSGLDLKDGMEVVVNTIRGAELGVCSGDVFDVEAKDLTSELKDVVRIATKHDKENYARNKQEEPKVVEDTKKFSKELDLLASIDVSKLSTLLLPKPSSSISSSFFECR